MDVRELVEDGWLMDANPHRFMEAVALLSDDEMIAWTGELMHGSTTTHQLRVDMLTAISLEQGQRLANRLAALTAPRRTRDTGGGDS